MLFNVRKVELELFWSILANIAETVHVMINVSMKHIYKVINIILVYIKIFGPNIPPFNRLFIY